MTDTDARTAIPARSPGLKRLLMLDTIGSLILIPLAAFWGVMSVMSSTTTANTAWANAYALVNLTLPVAMLLCLISGWIAWGLRRERIGWIIVFLPLLWVLVSVGMMVGWPAN